MPERLMRDTPFHREYVEHLKRDKQIQDARASKRKADIHDEIERDLAQEMRGKRFRSLFGGFGEGKLGVHKWLRSKGVS